MWKWIVWLIRLLAWPPPIRVLMLDRTHSQPTSCEKPQVAFIAPEPVGNWTLRRLAATKSTWPCRITRRGSNTALSV